MKNNLSALVDGELNRDDLERVCAALGDPEVRADWADFILIGAALREEGQLNFDVSARVMAALADEPTVLAPKAIEIPVIDPAHQRRAVGNQTWSALAAGIAGVSLVAWVALTLAPPETSVQLAASSAAPAVAPSAASSTSSATQTPLLAAASAPANDIAGTKKLPPAKSSPAEFQDYLVAHQAHVAGGAISGGSRNVRAVSHSRDGR